jgi:adenine C2-methylase RlmN of 23S rRNA A2503 and tRNA A37
MHSFMITEEERAELIRMLKQVLGETRVEVHRTHTPKYRERVLEEEALLRGLLDKFEHLRVDE